MLIHITFSKSQELRGYVTPSPELAGKLYNTQTGNYLSEEEVVKLKKKFPILDPNLSMM